LALGEAQERETCLWLQKMIHAHRGVTHPADAWERMNVVKEHWMEAQVCCSDVDVHPVETVGVKRWLLRKQNGPPTTVQNGALSG
jgi:hypothetical protein